MLRKLVLIAAFVALSPIGDAVNGYIKHPEGSCMPLAVLGPERMAFLCSGGTVMVARVSRWDLPRIIGADCPTEALNGLRAMMELKAVLYLAGDVRTTGSHWEGDRLYAQMLVDLDTVEQQLATRMPSLLDHRDRAKWCAA